MHKRTPGETYEQEFKKWKWKKITRQKKSREKTETPSKEWSEESTGRKTHHCPELLCSAQQYEIMGKRQRPCNDKSQLTRQIRKCQHQRNDRFGSNRGLY